MLKRAGGDDELIGEMAVWSLSQRFSPRDRAVLALAEHLTTQPAAALDDPLWAELRSHFAEGEIVELVACIGAFNAFNRMANSLAVEITR